MKDESIYLQHILGAIERIERYLSGLDEEGFRRDDLIQDGIVRQMEIIGEATKNISDRKRFASLIPIFPGEAWRECGTSSFTRTSRSTWARYGEPLEQIFHPCKSKLRKSLTRKAGVNHG